MKAVLILSEHSQEFSCISEANQSLSFLPLSLKGNILSYQFSKLNSVFSRDRIFVVCQQNEVDLVLEFCPGISEENIIIEPERLNISISMFYALLVINRIASDSTVFFFPANFIFKENFKLSNFINSSYAIAEKNEIIIPAIDSVLNIDDDIVVDAGKNIGEVLKYKFFLVNNVKYQDSEIKRRKIFGKQGKILYIVISKARNLLINFLSSDEHLYLNQLYEIFDKEDIDWNGIKSVYKEYHEELKKHSFFLGRRRFIVTFLDNYPTVIKNWNNYFEAVSINNNIVNGKVKLSKCERVIVFNYDNDVVLLEDMVDTLFYRKGHNIVVKKLKFI